MNLLPVEIEGHIIAHYFQLICDHISLGQIVWPQFEKKNEKKDAQDEFLRLELTYFSSTFSSASSRHLLWIRVSLDLLI